MVTHTVAVEEATEEVAEEVSGADSAGHWVPPDAGMEQGGDTGFAHKDHSTGLTQSMGLGDLSSHSMAPARPNAT